MGMGDIIQLITALGLGSIGGGVAGGVAAIWESKHDKELRIEESRRSRIAKWREEITDEKNAALPTAALAAYSELRSYLAVSDVERLETWTLNTSVNRFGLKLPPVQRGSTFLPDIQEHHILLRKIAQLEQEWHLI